MPADVELPPFFNEKGLFGSASFRRPGLVLWSEYLSQGRRNEVRRDRLSIR